MLEVPTTKRIYDWNRHGWITVFIYSADQLGCYKSVPPSLRPTRRLVPLTLRQRIHRYLKRYGPQTTKHLALRLMGSQSNKCLSGILQSIKLDPRIVEVGRTNDRYKKKVWGIKSDE